ncbi:Clp domain protein [Mycolicibacterium rhodesiae JS60]|nr:Clp domain protein [Mycolicibacterium rhodesiae JS60]
MVAGKAFPGEDLGPARVAGALAGLSPRARAVVADAYTEAYRYASDFVGSGHLLLGLVADASHAITSALAARAMTTGTVRRQFQQSTGARPRESPRHIHLTFSDHAKAVLIHAADQARDAGSGTTEVDHLWLALSRIEGSVAHHILSTLGHLPHLERLCAEMLPPPELT